jgi:Zn-dependent protease/predicted transcriptional regulator
MKWSWKIGEFAGIGVYVHATFLLIIAYVVFLHVSAGDTAAGVARGVLFVLAIFGCVVLHEFGHALAAKRYGIKTRDITLLPIGGVARLERMPDDPKQELVVALAGPAVNVVIAAALFVWLSLVATLGSVFEMNFVSGSFAANLMKVNIWLVVFNLIPAFPMDGGRVLRSLLATRMDYVRATNIAAAIGQAVAFLFVIEGLFGVVGLGPNPFLLFIALFVYMGAAQEAGMVQVKSALGGIPVQRAMLREFRSVGPADPLQHAVDLTLAGTQKDFPVVDAERRIVGLLCQDDLLRGLQGGGQNQPVSSVMKTEYQMCHPGEMLERVFMRLQENGAHTVPVTRDGELVGLLTMENIGEMLRIQAALDQRKSQMESAVKGM